MTNTQAILIGAAFIGASILLGNGMHAAQAQQSGPYMLMHHSNTVANAGVFRLDVTTGGVSYCFVSDPNGAGIICSREVK
ncbi:MAG: hypothetical protein WCD70_14015 [Alphaproteobacteria bacterium]